MRDDEAAAARLLGALIRASGLTPAQVQGRCPSLRGSLKGALAGNEDLSFHQILETLKALEVTPSSFFRALYPYPAQALDGGRLRESLLRDAPGAGTEASGPEGPDTDESDLDDRVRSVIALALREPDRP